MRRLLPGIVSDIDGVLQRGKSVFPYTAITLEKIMRNNLPFVFLTNGGGSTEIQRVKQLSQKFFQKDDILKASQLILCHTPLKELNHLKSKFVLLAGLGNLIDIAQDYGFQYPITVKEIDSLCPYLNPLHDHSRDKQIIQNLESRFKMSQSEIRKMQINAVMVMTDVDFMELSLQICSDMMISNGKITNGHVELSEKQEVKLYYASNDLVFPCEINIPRLAGGMFKECLDLIFKKQYNRQLLSTEYGKPSLQTYKYAENELQKQIQQLNQTQFQQNFDKFEISNIYMIGDNIHSDIQGVNNIKNSQSKYSWKSILVKSGVFQEGQNSNKADYIVNNFQDAISLICNLEGLPQL